MVLKVNAEDGDIVFWNNNSTEDSIIVKDDGTFVATLQNNCGMVSDTVVVEFEKCDNCILIPNAFSPNGDGLNDEFGVVNKCPENPQFMLQVFNRWGQRIFISYNVKDTWNGTFNGEQVEAGVYYYQLIYESNITHYKKSQKGSITLIR